MIKISMRRRSAWIGLIGVCFCCVCVVVAGAGKSEDEVSPFDPMESLISKDAHIRDLSVRRILKDRKDVIKQLIVLVEPKNMKEYSNDTRNVAAFLLGELRAKEAVDVLSRALEYDLYSDETNRIDPYEAAVLSALMKIGRPSAKGMVENIERTDNKILRRKSITVLSRVLGGKRHVLELLEKLAIRTEDKKKKERIYASIKFTMEYYKDYKEPLY